MSVIFVSLLLCFPHLLLFVYLPLSRSPSAPFLLWYYVCCLGEEVWKGAANCSWLYCVKPGC